MNRISSQLAARSGVRQIELLHAANRAGSAVDAQIVRAWNRLMRLLSQQPRPSLGLLQHHARHLLGEIYLAAHAGLRDNLGRLARLGHEAAAADLVRTLPVKFLRAAADGLQSNARTNRTGIRYPPPYSSSVGPFPDRNRLAVEEIQPRRTGVDHDLQEDFPRDRPGLVQFNLTPAGLSHRDRLGRLREPARAGMSDAEQRELLGRLLFPPPTAEMVAALLKRPIYGSSWEQELSTASRLAGFDAGMLAMRLVSGISQGKPPREVAKDILPAVDGVKSSARRIARTFGVQVGHGQAMAAHQALGDLVVGFQIHSALSPHSRPWHALRHGTVYFKQPGPGQKGMAQMPNPPLEADDPRERPPGTPRMAWN